MTNVPVEVLRDLAIAWRQEADILASERPAMTVTVTAIRHKATELDDVADHYSPRTEFAP